MQYNLEFGTFRQEACAFTFRAEIPPAPAIKVFSIPDLIDQVVLSIYRGAPRDFKKTQEKIRQLRLVSRAFFQAANPHFVVGLPFQKFLGREWMISPRITICGPYIRSIDLRAGNLCDVGLIKLVRGHCPNLEHITLLLEDTTRSFSSRHRYLTFFENVFSSSSIDADDNNVKIKISHWNNPVLEYLAVDKLVSRNRHYGNSDNPNELGDIEDDAMTVEPMRINATDAKALYELLKVTPELKSLTCHTVRWRGRGGGPEDLKLLKDCTWDYLEIDGNSSGSNLDNELKRYPSPTDSQ
ncbi:hypothetical protein BGZ80_010206 [Entomortierella chlamydospora]|uniref:Uncharacterized protein n=1 Tax=Entomortierella chlamydospora TaxID=101097 RepID=A0A9P6MV18_9FUNG|nr:hypothetical protein BGZ79_010066 [Entomortierella chlamydospora]KAG0014825.1 hypothetical protein BGZ80_010206 [Entomortierella chlamydospora]